MIGNEEDFTAALGFQCRSGRAHLKADPANFKKMIAEAVKMYPNFQAVATTLRNAKTASVNDWAPSCDRRRILRSPATREPGDL